MANKINSRFFGATGSAADPNLPIRFKLGGSVYEGIITKQVGARRFKVSTDDGTTATGIVKLTNAVTPASNGDGALVGLYSGQATPLRKINNRTAIDFNSRRFKWTLQDDSTETLIILTLIS